MKLVIKLCKRCDHPFVPADQMRLLNATLAARYRLPATNGYLCADCQREGQARLT